MADQTRLTGTYDTHLKYAPDNGTGIPSDSQYPDIFTALQTELGLKLVHQKVPLETLVIDHVERIHTSN